MSAKGARWAGDQRPALFQPMLASQTSPPSTPPGRVGLAKWMADQVNLASLRGACAGNHWDSLKELMPVYRAITVTDVGNGVRTSFWLDRWLPAGILMEVFPALYTHSLHKDASVAEVLSSQFRAHFAPRLTRAAAAELATLEEITEDIVLTLCPDNRRCKLAAQDGILRAGPVYRAAQHAQSTGDCAFYKFVGQNHAPRGYVSLPGYWSKRRSNAKQTCCLRTSQRMQHATYARPRWRALTISSSTAPLPNVFGYNWVFASQQMRQLHNYGN